MQFNWEKFRNQVEQYYLLENAISNPKFLQNAKITEESLGGMQIHAQVLRRSLNQHTYAFWSNFVKLEEMSNDELNEPFVDVSKNLLIESFNNYFGSKNVDVYVFNSESEDEEEDEQQQYSETLNFEIKNKNAKLVVQFPFTDIEDLCRVADCLRDIIVAQDSVSKETKFLYTGVKEVLWETQRLMLVECINKRQEFLAPLTKPLTAADSALFEMFESMNKFSQTADENYNEFVKRYCNYNDFYTVENMVELSDFIYNRKNAGKMIENLNMYHQALQKADEDKQEDINVTALVPRVL